MKLHDILILCVAIGGCSSPEDNDPAPDASIHTDTGVDATSTPDQSADALPDVTRDADLVELDVDLIAPDAAPDAGCTGACATLDLTATVGANSATFDRAFYGLTSPEQSSSGEWQLHVEVYVGGAAGCPSQNSPTPEQTLIIAGLQFPEFPALVTDDDGLAVTLLDFEGTLTDELPLRAVGEEVQFVDWQICSDCPGDDPDGFLAFELTAPVDDGLIEGHLYATHCSSLDAR